MKRSIEPDRDFQGADLLWRLATRAGRNLHVPREARRGAGPEAATAGNQRLYLNGTRAAQMSETLPLGPNSNRLGIGRHVSGIADPFNGHIDQFRLAHVQRSDGWIETTWNNMSDPGAFAAAGAKAVLLGLHIPPVGVERGKESGSGPLQWNIPPGGGPDDSTDYTQFGRSPVPRVPGRHPAAGRAADGVFWTGISRTERAGHSLDTWNPIDYGRSPVQLA